MCMDVHVCTSMYIHVQYMNRYVHKCTCVYTYSHKHICTTMYLYSYVRVLEAIILMSTHLTIDVKVNMFINVKPHLHICIPTYSSYACRMQELIRAKQI